jgi:polysaccharide pyruvyl transferase WcaK-like protein
VSLALAIPLVPNAIAKAIRSARVVLDVSGGDSFTDLYGERRFEDIIVPKRLAMQAGVPFILLPQTYGPYRRPTVRQEAARLCRAAGAAWARDKRSLGVLEDLLGDEFDPTIHRCGVDLAFLLPAMHPGDVVPREIQEMLAHRTRPIAGFNVSGLIYNDPANARDRYSLRADYPLACRRIVEQLVDDGATVLLLPHVGSDLNHVESDPRAIENLVRNLDEPTRTATRVVPFLGDPRAAKWLIGQCDWFCGMRMHSTIGGLSSGIPTAAISYSPKTLGVFESCGLGDQVFDPTALDTDELVGATHNSWRMRDANRLRAVEGSRAACRQAEEQMDAIALQIRSLAPRV